MHHNFMALFRSLFVAKLLIGANRRERDVHLPANGSGSSRQELCCSRKTDLVTVDWRLGAHR
jgi:hypothetical protein